MTTKLRSRALHTALSVWLRLVGPAALVLLLSGLVGAQSVLGTVRGTLVDPQGRGVPKAPIRVVDEGTGVLRATETDARGDYEVPNLRAGMYRVEDNSPGFAAFRRTGVVLRAGETVRIDLNLATVVTQEILVTGEEDKVKSPGVEIMVTAEGGTNIQLESSAIQGGLDAQQLSSLPRNARDFQDFLFLNPNVVGHPDGFQYLAGRSYGVSYLQDGQPSNGVLFGRVTNGSPGLDAVDEVKVLSSSYSAEFGGIAGIVVTSRRGTNRLSGSAFYDFNSDELNALSYTQKKAGLERGFQGSDTRVHRYGATLGGPIRKEKTFFFLNYEGSAGNQVGGGRIVTVPSERMRRGDFSEASFTVRDPQTGQPFPGGVIPPSRLDPAAQRILLFYYPIPNLSNAPNGLGRYQEFANLESTRNRWDARLDHELSTNDSLFVRFSWQDRNPGTFFENTAFPNLGVQDRRLNDRTVAASYLRIFSPNVLNEFRAGYNLDKQNRRSRYQAGEVADQLGIQIPSAARGRRGYPSFAFSGANSVIGVADNSENANRDIVQSSLSVSDTLTWLKGRHSFKLGGLYSRDTVEDGFSVGVVGAAGQFAFTGARSGNSVSDFLLGLPAQSLEGINTRGLEPLNAYSDVFAGFVQDDWKVTNRLTVFLGLRYELVQNFRERNDLLVNFDPQTGQLVIPSSATAPFLVQDANLFPRVTADDAGVSPALVNTDKNNLSPRVGFAYRIGADNRTVVRGGWGLFYPTAAAQGARDALSRSPFRTNARRLNPSLAQGFSTGAASTRPPANANAVDFDLESPEIMQYNLTVERELPGDIGLRVSYLGARKEKLLINRNINTVPASTVPFNPENPADRQRLPFPNLRPEVNAVESTGSGHFNAFQVEAHRRFRQGFAFNLAYTFSESRSDAPDYGNSSLGIVQYDPYDRSKSVGPDPYVVRHRLQLDATWDIPVGRNRRFGSGMPGWANVFAGGWTISAIALARSGFHLTPFYTDVDSSGVNPANTGFPRVNNDFSEAWRPDVVGNPNGSRDRNNFYNLAAFRLPAPGTTGNAGAGIIEGPGTWIVNFGLYKDLVRGNRFSLQFRATLDNAFNHPQFQETTDSPFLDLTDYLVNGLPVTRSNGTTGVLGTVASFEGYAPFRAVRLGLKLQF